MKRSALPARAARCGASDRFVGAVLVRDQAADLQDVDADRASPRFAASGPAAGGIEPRSDGA